MPRAFHYDRHPEVPERSEGLERRRPASRPQVRGPLILRGSLRSHLRMTVVERCALPADRLAFFRSSLFPSHITFVSSIITSPLVSARRSARGSSRFLVPTPNEGGGGAPQGAHWVFDHAGEARCRVNGTRRSRCDRDRAPRRSTVAISGRGTTLQLRQCPPDPRCDLPAGPIARPGRLGPVPPAPRFATVGHGTPRPAPSGGSSPETPLMSENESGVA